MRVTKLREKKTHIEKQNAIIAKIKDTEKLAILSRYAEINDANRIETVKLP